MSTPQKIKVIKIAQADGTLAEVELELDADQIHIYDGDVNKGTLLNAIGREWFDEEKFKEDMGLNAKGSATFI